MNVCLFALLSKYTELRRYSSMQSFTYCVYSSYRWTLNCCILSTKILGLFHIWNCKVAREKLQIQRIDVFNIFVLWMWTEFFFSFFCSIGATNAHTHTNIHKCALLLFCEKFLPKIRLTFHFIFRFDDDTFSVRPSTESYAHHMCVLCTVYSTEMYTHLKMDICINVCAFFSCLANWLTEWQSDFGTPFENLTFSNQLELQKSHGWNHEIDRTGCACEIYIYIHAWNAHTVANLLTWNFITFSTFSITITVTCLEMKWYIVHAIAVTDEMYVIPVKTV